MHIPVRMRWCDRRIMRCGNRECIIRASSATCVDRRAAWGLRRRRRRRFWCCHTYSVCVYYICCWLSAWLEANVCRLCMHTVQERWQCECHRERQLPARIWWVRACLFHLTYYTLYLYSVCTHSHTNAHDTMCTLLEARNACRARRPRCANCARAHVCTIIYLCTAHTENNTPSLPRTWWSRMFCDMERKVESRE